MGLFKILPVFAVMVLVSPWVMAANNKPQEVKPLTGEDMKMAMEMNASLSKHMYSTACLTREKALRLPPKINGKEKIAMISGFQKSCDCLADKVIAQSSPNDVIDFVTRFYGTNISKPQEKDKSAAEPKPKRTEAFNKIMYSTNSEESRKSCGFRQ